VKQAELEKEFMDKILSVQGILHRICNVYSNTPMDREDLMQDIMMNAWRAYPKFEGRSKFSTWLYKVALNTALMKIRDNKKKEASVFIDIENIAGTMAGEDRKTDDDIKQLYYAINRLEDIEKSIILLYLDDLSYKEIAEITGITDNNTGVKINRIKHKLKDIINGA